MMRIALVNMPFANVQLPSIALAQLKSVLRDASAQVSTSICYLNHDFSDYFGHEYYAHFANSVALTVSGLGDWIFRQAAFPDAPDNTDEYVARHRHVFDHEQSLFDLLLLKRSTLVSFLDELIDRYELLNCSVVGFTSMFVQNVASFALARRLKDRDPNIITVIGGANCETCMGRVIAENVEAIDFVFSGPALKTFPKFVKFVADDQKEKNHQLTGVFSSKNLREGKAFNEIGDELGIDEDVPLDYDDFLASFEQKCRSFAGAPELLFETSRGCWWGERSHCTFCGLNGMSMQYRSMTPEKALRQFAELFKRTPRVSHFKSVDNILPKEYITDVLPYMKTPKDVSIFYEIKADLKDAEMKLLAQAGVTEIQPGIEALATATLKLMKKGTSAFQNLGFLKSCLVHRINPAWNLLIGFPGEEEAVYEKYCDDLPSLVHLPPPTGVYPVRFDRFSPYFKYAAEYQLALEPYDFYGLVYPFEEAGLKDLAYFFQDRNYQASYIALTAKWIRKLQAKVDFWHSRWYQKDRRLKPKLVFAWRGDERIVYDSRSGAPVEHRVGPAGLGILDLLTVPLRLPDIGGKLKKFPDMNVQDALQSLKNHGLIFGEGDRYLSLITDSDRVEGAI
jgi:ribosomal peptide maturation radical SAM protein 1